MGTISIAVQQCRLYLHWGPGHPQPNGGPLLESIYRVTVDYVRHSQYSNHVQHRGAHRIFFPGDGHRRRKGSVIGGHHGECGARAYNGGLGAEPPAGSKDRAHGQRKRNPLKLKAFWSLDIKRSRQI